MVDYHPRYPQPFTFSEAVQFDVSTITEEISRLQNSLRHLRQTQELLKEALDTGPDVEVKAAFDENEQVIPAQEERITILKLALAEKGIEMGSHYDVAKPNLTTTTDPSQSSGGNASSALVSQAEIENNDADGGIHL
ncbi:hypothetical protein Moror_7412 [Moniliophthora roreri MCA 2997]|uniref:Uncharacterized protein n=2 Tax=Moniliophthora roreri TaxID=221103 RepID=V2XQQ5_MONRO|nr:hypothetical protein Moror_7412 [Moniliophthora roreri MCA 2997]KAI3612285.1 hypothetical protein WG66_012186 [Moniliophthora roreri]